MESLIETFHLDWKLMVAQVVNFAIVFIVLYVFAIKPLKKLMDERGKTIKGGLDNAKLQAELVAGAKADYDAAIRAANADAAAKMQEARKELDAYRAAETEKAQAAASEILAAGRRQLEADKAAMLAGAKQEIAGLVVAATEKVLGTVAEGKIDRALVDESIKEI